MRARTRGQATTSTHREGSGSLGTKWPGGNTAKAAGEQAPSCRARLWGRRKEYPGVIRKMHRLTSVHPPPGGDRPPLGRLPGGPQHSPPGAPGSLGHSPSSSACNRSGAHRANSSARTPGAPAPVPMASPDSRPAGSASRPGPTPPLPAWGSLLRGPARRGHPAQIGLGGPRQREGVSSPPRPARPAPSVG